MMNDFNTKLDELATHVLAAAKQNLSATGKLLPVAFVIDKDFAEIKCLGLVFDGHEEKRAAYDAIAQLAIKSDAHAIITINDVRYKTIAKEQAREEMAKDYRHGEICDNPENPEAIVMTILPRTGPEHAVMAHYRRVGENIIYGEENRLGNDSKNRIRINLIPESWRQAVTARQN
jgi:hypothetical protein